MRFPLVADSQYFEELFQAPVVRRFPRLACVTTHSVKVA
jgi:hypothetical protein